MGLPNVLSPNGLHFHLLRIGNKQNLKCACVPYTPKEYQHHPTNLQALKAEIMQEFTVIPQEMVYRSIRKRLQNCIDIDCRHLTDVLFKI